MTISHNAWRKSSTRTIQGYSVLFGTNPGITSYKPSISDEQDMKGAALLGNWYSNSLTTMSQSTNRSILRQTGLFDTCTQPVELKNTEFKPAVRNF